MTITIFWTVPKGFGSRFQNEERQDFPMVRARCLSSAGIYTTDCSPCRQWGKAGLLTLLPGRPRTTALPSLPGKGSKWSRKIHILRCRFWSQGLGDHFCPLGIIAGLGLRLGSWRVSGGSPTADEDEFVGPIAATLFSFGGQCCDDALDIGIIGDGHHLGVGHGGVVNNLDPSWKPARIGRCHLLGGLRLTRLLLGWGPLRLLF